MNPKQLVDDLRESLRAFNGEGSDDEIIHSLALLYCNLFTLYEQERAKKSAGYARVKPAEPTTNGEMKPHDKEQDL
jgi:hypothetical protein